MTRGALVSPLGALALSLVLAGQAGAATWTSPERLGDGAWGRGLAVAGNIAVAMYAENEATYARRSLDGGTTWRPPIWLTSDAPGGAYDHDIDGFGNFVDVVYVREGRLRYRRSVDAGGSFSPPRTLSPAGDDPLDPRVSHGPGGLLVIAWAEPSGAIQVRVSTDDGWTFGVAQTIAISEDVWVNNPVVVAVGNQVVYVAYYRDDQRLRLKRSVDHGVTWSSATQVSNVADAYSGLDMTAAGSHAYLAYGTWDADSFSAIDYRRTVDSGETWSDRMDLSPEGWSAFGPHLFLRGGVLRAAFTSCVDNWDYCDPNTAWYRQSPDGTSWTTPQRISPQSFDDGMAEGVVHAGRPIVLFSGFRDDWGAWVRTRTP